MTAINGTCEIGLNKHSLREKDSKERSRKTHGGATGAGSGRQAYGV